MKKNTGTYNRQFFTILIMVNLLLYPFVYSFQHALTHHLDQHQHNTESSHHCCSIDVPEPAADFHLSTPEEECPICSYEFAQGLNADPVNTNGPAVIIGSGLHAYNQSLFWASVFQCSVPRAPPVAC
ncbi:hypothetical protein [Roseimarinus sediminis]|uniref:hypothetical protein n=1 Tax=Roseimarinus sediminis TaxID=1610899 RepID=UPI003D208170